MALPFRVNLEIDFFDARLGPDHPSFCRGMDNASLRLRGDQDGFDGIWSLSVGFTSRFNA